MKNVLMVNRLLILMLLFTSAVNVDAQQGKVPPFRIMQADGRLFKAEYLPVGKPILVIYFAPDCEECQKLTADLLKRIDEFRNVSIALITYQPVNSMAEYVRKNNLRIYDNIYAGTEYPTTNVMKYYGINKFPFMALYTKDGNLVRKYAFNEIDVDDLLGKIKFLR